MNKILIILALALSIASCKKEEDVFTYDNTPLANTRWDRAPIFVEFTETHITWYYHAGDRGTDVYYVVGNTIYIGQDRKTTFQFRVNYNTLYWWIDPKTGVNRYILSKR